MGEPLVRKAGILEDEVGLHVLPLSMLLTEALGPEFLGWTSEALREECEDRWGKIGVLTWERIQALRVLHIHDAYWKEWEVFEKITAAIIGEAPIFNLVQPPEAEEIAVSLSVAAKVDRHEFDDDVKAYIVSACLNDGLWYYEDPIASAVGSVPAEMDRRMGILRDEAAVASELQKSDKFRPPSDDPILEQTNRVLDIRYVLKKYDKAVADQLADLPKLAKTKKQ